LRNDRLIHFSINHYTLKGLLMKMKSTSIQIILKGRSYNAHLLATQHDDFMEYHITPTDEDLKGKYGTQSIAVYTDRPYLSSIIQSDIESLEYSRALIIGLHDYLSGH
jgi:hypothetical protein